MDTIITDEPPVELCVTCGNYPAKFDCDGCGDDYGRYCGHCARPNHVVFAQMALTQRLCPTCRLSGDSPRKNMIYDARNFTMKEIKQHYGIT